MTEAKQTFNFIWNDIKIQVNYTPNYATAEIDHLEIISDSKTPISITETGYKSHFILPEEFKSYNLTPVEFFTQWLDEAAQEPSWIEAQAQQNKMSLF